MAKLVIVKNPFQPWNGREIKTVPNGFTIRQAAELYGFNGVEINCVLDDGVVVADDYVLTENNLITISPYVGKGGKSIFALVAVVALSVVSMGVGGLAAGGVWGAAGWTAGANMLAGFAAAAAVMFIGSTLIGRFVGQTADVGNYSYDSDATYSWSGVQTMEGQNNAIALTYGTVKSGGQSIGKYVNVSNNDEYLNWLVCAGQGPLTLSDIKLNDNDYNSYSDVTVETREGTNDQTVCDNFKDTYFTKALSYQLLSDERIDTCQGNATEGIKLKLECSNGLYYANDDGGLGNAWINYTVWYAKYENESDTLNWLVMASGQISGAQSSAIRKEISIGNLTAGKYKVKVQITGRSHEVTNSRASTRIWWTELTSIVYDDFSYPNMALISVKAKATDQLSGTPSLTFLKTRSKVWVYNPYSNEYEEQNADNPAWAAYDFVHQACRLKNIATGEYEFEVRGVPAKAMLYDQFKTWADFCDDYELKVNIEINSTGEMLQTVNEKISPCGRGMVVRFGTKYGAVFECAKQPVQMFGMGNIISGSFQEEFLQTSDRANAVEITYTDKYNDYNRETVTIYSDTYDTDAEEKVAQATFDGITSYEQAYREGVYQLLCNKYQLRTVSFTANIDAIACMIGDVILVAHDIPKWAKSGRIADVDTENNTLTLPIESVDESAGTYRVSYRTINDTIKTSNVTFVRNADGEVIVKCATVFDADDMPQTNDIFDLALVNIGSKPFIVKSITRAQDFTRNISCIEYNENIYAKTPSTDIPVKEYSQFSEKPQNVTNLTAVKYKYTSETAKYKYRLEINWNVTGSGTYDIYTSLDGLKYNLLISGVNANSYLCDCMDNIAWVRVVTRYKLLSSSGVAVSLTEQDFNATPNAPTNASVVLNKTFLVKWDAVTNAEIGDYELRLDQNVGVQDKNLLASTTQTQCELHMTNREGYIDSDGTVHGTPIYLYAISTMGKVSEVTTVQYNFPQPSAPVLTSTVGVKGADVSAGSLASNCYATKFTISKTGFSRVKTEYDSYSTTIDLASGIYSVTACYLDYFGEGKTCASISVDVPTHIDASLLTADDTTYSKLNDGMKALLNKGGESAVSAVASTLAGKGAAITLQDDGSYALVASNGDKVSGIFGTTTESGGGVLRLEGDYIHVTGDTVFDEDVIIKGKMTAGSVSCDDGVSINAGAVTLDSSGLNCKSTSGDSVRFDSSGMTFIDANDVPYGNIGRMVIGTAEHGQTVTFKHEWANSPTVICMPQNFQSTYSGYDSTNLKVQAYPTPLDGETDYKKGFVVNCFTSLLDGTAGTGGSVDIGSNSKNFATQTHTWQSKVLGTVTVSKPESATNITVNCSATYAPVRYESDASTETEAKTDYISEGSAKMYFELLAGDDDTVVNSTWTAETSAYTAITGTASFTWAFDAGTTLKVRATYYIYSNSTRFNHDAPASAKIASTSYNVTGVQPVGTGTATFIALENMNDEVTVS